MKIILYSLFIFPFFIFCSPAKYKNKTASVIKTQEDVAPNHCRVLATLVTIENNTAAYTDGPCSKASCDAYIEIKSVLGYGSAFRTPLNPGDKIKAHFAFTLKPTSKELFPNMKQFYPGLKQGDQFITDLESLPAAGNEFNYTIYDYSLK